VKRLVAACIAVAVAFHVGFALGVILDDQL
jgi:hypothetical protein